MGQCASNKSKQTLISKKKCKHPFLIIPYSKKAETQSISHPALLPSRRSQGKSSPSLRLFLPPFLCPSL
ncbi:hypothetical protein M8J76_005719 [Diaphorina citri]|nr:hypothetical protein M8J76_005719 [Diaphorina citri]